ncbi:host-nuclease inhibitor Gam family protein [Polymorphobacter sp.]|uniref:host-nuclease inhibitor Gam family protein n=1 Tax=Polymorphobacter sp. TaxID=1909290 RepID=UPI003F6E764F
MAAKRRRAEKLPACQSIEEAVQLLGRFAQLDAQLAERKARVETAIASLRAQQAELDAPAEAEIKGLFLQLKPWWAVAGETITEGKRKSAELAGCLIGHRIGNPTLVFPKPEDDAIAKIEALNIEGLVRISKALDKEALIKALRATEDKLNDDDKTIIAELRDAGFDVTQKETFFIDRIPPKESPVETIVDPQAEQVPA